jgi:4-hydroxybenzoate polyprenyltransferase
LAVSLINVAYSLFCKKVRFLDVVAVGLWGAAFASIVTASPAWVVLAGAMTAICHIYQASEDRDADTSNGVVTSARLTLSLLSLVQTVLIGTMVAAAWTLGAPAAALTFAGFLVYWWLWRDQPRTAWIVTKVHFTLILAYLILRG